MYPPVRGFLISVDELVREALFTDPVTDVPGHILPKRQERRD